MIIITRSINYLTVLITYAIVNLYTTACNVHQCALVHPIEFAISRYCCWAYFCASCSISFFCFLHSDLLLTSRRVCFLRNFQYFIVLFFFFFIGTLPSRKDFPKMSPKGNLQTNFILIPVIYACSCISAKMFLVHRLQDNILSDIIKA